jgi:hypothetical protein
MWLWLRGSGDPLSILWRICWFHTMSGIYGPVKRPHALRKLYSVDRTINKSGNLYLSGVQMFDKFTFSAFQPTIFVFNRGMIQGFKANFFVENLRTPMLHSGGLRFKSRSRFKLFQGSSVITSNIQATSSLAPRIRPKTQLSAFFSFYYDDLSLSSGAKLSLY